jgi:hypothetical protein
MVVQMQQVMVVKLQMVEQRPYPYLLQLSQLAVVAVDQKEQMAQQAEMVVEADIVIMLEQLAQLEDSLVAMPMAMAVAVAEAQEPLELQEAQEETVETVCLVQFLEAQRIMAAAAEVEVTAIPELV